MRDRLGKFFRKHGILAYAILFLCVFFLVFIVPKTVASLESPEREGFILSFIPAFLITSGILLMVLPKFFKKKSSSQEKEKKQEKSPVASMTYQQLLDEVAHCFKELKKFKYWTIACLLVGWISLMTERLIAAHDHPVYAIPIFALAFLAGTKNLEKEQAMDSRIAKCTLEGVKFEKKRGLKSIPFQELAKDYEGWGMSSFMFLRVSPPLMILYSLINNAGTLQIFANHFSSVPWWALQMGTGAVLAGVGFYLAKMASDPYRWLLANLRNDGSKPSVST